jgi:cephalosporin hydroxylase
MTTHLDLLGRRRYLRWAPAGLKQFWRTGVTNEFSRIYYERSRQTWKDTYWLGVRIRKNPVDLWIYQEILWEVQPQLIIETGTAFGGSALLLASLCDLLDGGRVVTVDLETREDLPRHPRITYLCGSSTDQSIIRELTEVAKSSARVLVILDSDHRKSHVLEEMRAYGHLVTPGSYLIVEDTNINGHPVASGFGPGPMEAVEEFLREDGRFTVDKSREKFMMTWNPSGYLRREETYEPPWS